MSTRWSLLKKGLKMKSFIGLFFLISYCVNVQPQSIEFGQDAEHIKRMAKLTVQQNYRIDTFGNRGPSNAFYDVKYENGVITDVILCYNNQYLLDYKVTASFCRHYLMEKEKLTYIITQFENISLEKLHSIHNKLYNNKLNDCFFSADYSEYSKVYLAENGNATIKLMKTDTTQLPKSIKGIVIKKLKENEEIEKQKKLAIEQEKKRAIEIKAKTYDLFEYDKIKYEETFAKIKKNILEHFYQNSFYYNKIYPQIPTYSELENGNDKKYIFRNTYSAYFKLEDYSTESGNYGSLIVAGSHEIRQKNEIKLVTGTDTKCNLFSSFPMQIPTIKIDNYEVMTEARYENINVEFTKGITIAELENGEIKFIENEPCKDVQSQIAEKISFEAEGKYIVKYEASNINGEVEVKTTVQEKPNVFMNTAKIVGVALAVLLLILVK